MIQPAVPYTGEPATLPLHMIESKEQIRMRNGFDQESLAELSDTIRTHGLMQPLVVRRLGAESYELVAGERRLLACSMAGLAEVPVLIREVTDEDVPALQAIENLQRVDLTVLDKADGVAAIVTKLGQKRAASMLGKSPAWVSKMVQIAKQPDAIREVAEFVEDVASLGLLRQLRNADKAKFAGVAAAITDGKTYSRDQLTTMVRAAKKPEQPPVTPDATSGNLFDGNDAPDDDAPDAKTPQRVSLARADAELAAKVLRALARDLPPSGNATDVSRALRALVKALG